MGGLNSLSGLDNISVDFRPAIEPVQPNKTGEAQVLLPELETVQQQPAAKPTAKSVVRELDVLLLNAASKSVASDAASSVKRVGDMLVQKGVLTSEEADNLSNLAKKASNALKALDKFSGRELATALMTDTEGALTWKKGFFGMNAAAKAVKAAIDSQLALEAIEHAEKLNEKGKVLDDEQWKDPMNLLTMLEVRPTVEITKSDNTTVMVDSNIKCVKDYSTRICPSYYKRDNFQDLFS